MTTSRLHLAMLSVLAAAYLAQTGAMYTGTSANDTSASLAGDSLALRGYYGDNDALMAGRRLAAMSLSESKQRAKVPIAFATVKLAVQWRVI